MNRKGNREYRLQLLLAQTTNFLTADELAARLNISKKTVYRLIKQVNESANDGTVIESAKGRGYRLNQERYILQKGPSRNDIEDISPADRQERVMEALLLASPKALKIRRLYSDFYVGDSTITNDEKVISKRLKKYGLNLTRKNRTLQITGSEPNIRKAIVEITQALNFVDIDDLKGTVKAGFNHYDMSLVLEQISTIEKILGEKVPYPYNVNLFSHLYILISRVKQGMIGCQNSVLTLEEKETMATEPRIAKIARQTIDNIGRYLHRHLPDVEQYYLFQYLVSSRLPDLSDRPSSFSKVVMDVTNYYLHEVGHRLNLETSGTANFRDLASHVKPMLNRLKNDIRVKNVLLDQIKLSYQTIFDVVTEVSAELSEKYHLPQINADENGFITLYFARMSEVHQLPIQTLVMCTTGIGTSELLRAKIQKHFPELDIVDVVNTREYQQYLRKYPQTKLIITTVALRNKLPVRSLLVSAMLNSDDQARIQKVIEEVRNEK